MVLFISYICFPFLVKFYVRSNNFPLKLNKNLSLISFLNLLRFVFRTVHEKSTWFTHDFPLIFTNPLLTNKHYIFDQSFLFGCCVCNMCCITYLFRIFVFNFITRLLSPSLNYYMIWHHISLSTINVRSMAKPNHHHTVWWLWIRCHRFVIHIYYISIILTQPASYLNHQKRTTNEKFY